LANTVHQAFSLAAVRWARQPFLCILQETADIYDIPAGELRYAEAAERVEFLRSAYAAAGYGHGHRVGVLLENRPSFFLHWFALNALGVSVVPINPDMRAAELEYLIGHSEIALAIALPHRHDDLKAAAAKAGRPLRVMGERDVPPDAPFPAPFDTEPNVLTECALLYTSGTTGRPKGCMHTHRSTQYNAVAGGVWGRLDQGLVGLAVLPMFHVTGLQANLNLPLYLGATVVVLPRWDRDAAARCVEKHHITSMPLITAMVIDFMANPQLDRFDLRSLRRIAGGGASMPRAVALQLEHQLGIRYGEGYGMSETMAATHSNPPDRPKEQCLGMPIFDVDARVVDPATLQELPQGQTGEIIVHGPQVMQGYWNQPEATAEAFVQVDGKRFLRTGDLAYVDDEGYFFFVDRLKRMINAAGFKVWPAEVEALLYQHPAIQEACIIAASDPRRGETVKAVVVLKPGFAGQVTEQQITDWAHEHMAAYKVPRIVQFVDALPRSGTGKVMWRTLQEAERERS